MTLSGVERVGPFVRVKVHISGRLARLPNEVPHLYYGGTEYYLLGSGESWVIVDTGRWIT